MSYKDEIHSFQQNKTKQTKGKYNIFFLKLKTFVSFLERLTMDCSICLEKVDETTGSATLSCGHLFHFGCLARWILKNETCPYCRHQTNAFESIQESDDEETLSDDESQSIEQAPSLRWIRVGPGHWRIFEDAVVHQIPDYDENAHALWVFRNFFEALENTNTLEVSASQEKEHHIPYRDIFHRHLHTYDISNDRGYESA